MGLSNNLKMGAGIFSFCSRHYQLKKHLEKNAIWAIKIKKNEPKIPEPNRHPW
jgi:hypothetical protein